jgi:hypothetical protein
MSQPLIAARVEGTLLKVAAFRISGSKGSCVGTEALKPGEKSKFAGNDAVLLLNESERSLRHFVLPPGAPANLKRMALLQAQARLPDAAGNYLLDVVLEKSGKQTAALTAAIPILLAEQGAKRLKDAGLDLGGIALEPLCYAALAPERGTALLELSGWSVACRENGAVGWRNEPGIQLFEEYLCAEPREFKPDAEISGGELASSWGVDATQLPLLAAAVAGSGGVRARKQPRFQDFLDRETRAPASLRRKLALSSVWAAGVAMVLGGFFLLLQREEQRYEVLKDKAAQYAQHAKLSQRMMKELGQQTQLLTALRGETVEKPLAVAPLRALSDMLPAGVKLTALSYTADGQMLLDGEAQEPRLPVLLLDLLRNAPGFSPPVLEFVSDRGSDKFIFRISCKPRTDELPSAPPPAKSEKPKGEIEL